MTRGTLALITEGGIYNSIEFNGNMGNRDLGSEVVPALKSVTTLSEFEKMVNEFNLKNHNYDEEEMVFVWEGTLKTSFKKNVYFEKWFSDYLYIKNATKENIEVLDYNGKLITFPAEEVTVLNFGEEIEEEE